MLFRYRARNFPATLNEQEADRWRQHCQERLQNGVLGDENCLSLTAYEQAIVQLTRDMPGERAEQVASALQDWKSDLLRCLSS